MRVTVIGGSGSGKSEYAENLAAAYADKNNIRKKYYIAAMKPFGEEAMGRIQRHHELRARKGFTTIECYTELERAAKQADKGTALLECMSNLTANEMFDIGGDAEGRIRRGLEMLEEACGCLIIVTNDVFSDGIVYGKETQEYNRVLGGLNRFLVETSDLAVEVVYGCPVVLKGALSCLS